MYNPEFLITSLIVVLLPGTGVIYTVSTGLFCGRRESIGAAIGCTAGIIPHLTASILGLSAILHVSAVAFQAVKYAGVLYLLYLAWSMWRETGSLKVDGQSAPGRFWKVALRGFLINILNPKLSIFFLAFLPLFVSPTGSSPLLQLLMLSGIFMLMTLVIFILYGLTAHYFRRYLVDSPVVTSRLQKSFAVVFAALGIKLAVTN